MGETVRTVRRLRRIIRTGLVPGIGAPVWWAPKGVGLVVTALKGDIATLQGGPIIRNRKGHEVPRWTVAVNVQHCVWDRDVQMWFVGRGEKPAQVSGLVLTPAPVALSGTSQGSFAPGGR